MASVYPNNLDELATDKTGVTEPLFDHPTHHNEITDALNEVQAALGTHPSGDFNDVGARATASEDALYGASAITLCEVGAVMPSQRTPGRHFAAHTAWIPSGFNLAGGVPLTGITYIDNPAEGVPADFPSDLGYKLRLKMFIATNSLASGLRFQAGLYDINGASSGTSGIVKFVLSAPVATSYLSSEIAINSTQVVTSPEFDPPYGTHFLLGVELFAATRVSMPTDAQAMITVRLEQRLTAGAHYGGDAD